MLAKGHRVIEIGALVLIGGIAAVLVLGLRMRKENQPTAELPDTSSITDTIRAALTYELDGCMATSQTEVDLAKQGMDTIWSQATPSGDELATKESVFGLEVATPNPTAWAKNSEALIARHAQGKITTDTLESSLHFALPTPDWHPFDSPLDNAHTSIDRCQLSRDAVGRLTRFSVDSVEVSDLIVNNDVAVVNVVVSETSTFLYTGDTSQEYHETPHFEFVMIVEDGAWKIKKKTDTTPQSNN